MASRISKVIRRLISLTADPSSGLADGDQWYNSTSNQFMNRAGGVTVEAALDRFGYARSRTDEWYAIQEGTTSSNATAEDRLVCSPFIVQRPLTLGSICYELVSACTNGLLRAGVYADDGGGRPGALLVDAGTVSATTTGIKKWSSLGLALTPGIYWLATVPQGTTAAGSYTTSGGQHPLIGFVETDPVTTGTNNARRYETITGALGSLTGVTPSATGAGPHWFVKFS